MLKVKLSGNLIYMKTKQLLLGLVAIAFLAGASIFLLNDVDLQKDIKAKEYQVRKSVTSESNSYGATGAAEWFRARRVNPATGTISNEDIKLARKSFELAELNRKPQAVEMNWEYVGPDNVGGRTRAIMVDNRDNKTLWAGGVAGGLWKSTTGGLSWIPIALDNLDNIIISSLCQDKDGNIYFGTGENFSNMVGTNTTSIGFEGGGIWKSTDGATFNRLESTNDLSQFRYVNELIYDEATNSLYAGTNYSLLVSKDGGATWNSPFGSRTGNTTDIKVTPYGKTIVYSSVGSRASVYVAKNGGDPVGKAPQFDTDDSFNRIELAIAPSDPNYMYALCSYNRSVRGKYFNLYQSKDGGDNWHSVLQQHTPVVDLFRGNSQGDYDNTVAVFPDDPGKVIIGGIDLWTWSEENAFEQISFWLEGAGVKFVHADQHNIYFHPDYENNKTIYFTNDGGIFISRNSGTTFSALNTNYGVTQFYAIDCGPKGEVLGGCQDNGSQYLNLLQPSDPTSAVEISGGDGGYAAISELYAGAVFSTTYNDILHRSNENGASATMQDNPYDDNTYNNIDPGNKRNPFVTPINLWESFDYDSSRIYIPYEVDTVLETNTASGIPDTITAFAEGYTFFVPSTVVDRKRFEYTVTAEDIANNGGDSIRPGDTLAIRERFAALMAIGAAGNNGGSGKLYITRYMLNFKDEHPKWDALVSSLESINSNLGIQMVTNVKWSPDGAYLYAIGQTSSGYSLFRFSGIQNAYNYTGPTYDQRTVTSDSTVNLSRLPFEQCDTSFINGLNTKDISSQTEEDVNHDVYSLTAGTVDYTYIFSLDSIIGYPTVNDTLINIEYKDTVGGTCIVEKIDSINNDTITNLVASIRTVTYYEYTMNDATVYDSIVRADTIVHVDTTYQMGVIGPDMVWNTRHVNTIKQVKGQLLKNFGWKTPTSIAVDPKNVDNLMVTVGGYGSHDRIYYTTKATTSTGSSSDFKVKDGTGLPSVPFYSSLISDTAGFALVGTEYGVYSTTNISDANPTWVRETSMPRVPVLYLTQQLQPNGYLKHVCETGVRNSGVVYAGTHGLGAWKMNTYQRPYTGVSEIKPEKVDALMVKIFPNPVKSIANVEYTVVETSDVEIAIYSLSGKLVYKQILANQYKGRYVHQINAEGYTKGVYVLSLTSNGERKVSKFIVE